MMTPGLFADGLTLFAFDLTPDLCGGYHMHNRRTGSIDLEVQTKTPLTDAVYAIALCTYDAQVLIRQNNKRKNEVSAKILNKKQKED